MNDLTLLVPETIPVNSAVAGFTTRRGGVSGPPFDSLNLGVNTQDNPDAIQENYRILYNHIGIGEEHVALMSQIHRAGVNVVEKGGLHHNTDAILTEVPGLLLGVRVADCVPVLVYDTRKGIAGAIHCGWKPLVSGIVEGALETMHHTWKSDPMDIRVTLGPSAGPCCYEIGNEVASCLSPRSVIERNGRLFGDLRNETLMRLEKSGILLETVEQLTPCTICGESLFYSYRRDGMNSGRMMGFIMSRI